MKNENVLSVPLDVLKSRFDLSKQWWTVSFDELNELPNDYVERNLAEKDFSHKQLIPYVLLFNESGLILCYQRQGSEKRLADKHSVGIGGHVNPTDVGKTLYDTLVRGLRREIQEETGVDIPPSALKLAGMINEDETEVGWCHLGVVFVARVKMSEVSFSDEIGFPIWSPPKMLELSRFELWSELALRLLNDNVNIFL